MIRVCCCFVGILIRSSSWDFCCLFALFVLVLVLILVVLLLVVGFWWDPHRKEGDLRISQLVSAAPGMRGRSHLPSWVKWDSVVWKWNAGWRWGTRWEEENFESDIWDCFQGWGWRGALSFNFLPSSRFPCRVNSPLVEVLHHSLSSYFIKKNLN